MLAHTVNGTTYAGIRGRTTGAPQNHWFGPSGDPRGAGIGTPEVPITNPPPPPALTHTGTRAPPLLPKFTNHRIFRQHPLVP